jgi:large subunit ribosomal protein L25
MADVLQVQIRDTRGKHNARRLRRSGAVPAVLYGHGEQTVSLALGTDELASAVRHGSQLVDLQGAVKEKALIRELQWDVYSTEILHVDLARVSEHELVQVTVTVEVRGEAPGTKEGGVLELAVHEFDVECPASAIPEKIVANVNELALGETLTVADLDLPSQVKILVDDDTVVVSCHLPAVEEEEEAVEATGAEPEVIGRAGEEDESAE